MAFCPNCGSAVEGRFCAKCGTSVSVDAGPAAGSPPPAGSAFGSPGPATQPVASAGLSENVVCALCYLLGLITGILFLVIAPYNSNKNIRFHAFQSIFLHVAWIVLIIVEGIIASALPFGIHFLASLLYLVVALGGLALWLYMMFSAYQGRRVKLPVIGDLAEKQA